MHNKQKIIKSFNSSAAQYHSMADVQPLIAKRLARDLIALRAESILEIGCGTGLYSQYLTTAFPHARIVLGDIASSMLLYCERNLGGKHPHVEFIALDGECLRMDRQFDLITSSMTLHWFSDIQSSIHQMMHHLKPGGKLVLAMLGHNSLSQWRNHCRSHQLSTSPDFIDATALQTYFPTMQIRVELLQQPYQNTHEFFKTLKQIGAATPHPAHRCLTAGSLRHLMRALDSQHTQGISMTYEVIYAMIDKS